MTICRNADISTTICRLQISQVQKIIWEKNGENFIARFDAGARKITAIYSSKGQLISTLIVCNAGYIPFEFQTELAKKYPDYTLRLMKEHINKENCNYYFILNNQRGSKVTWLSVKPVVCIQPNRRSYTFFRFPFFKRLTLEKSN